MQLNFTASDDHDTALLERPAAMPVFRPCVLVPAAAPAPVAEDFRLAACNLPREAKFMAEILPRLSWHADDMVEISMAVGRRTRLSVDLLPLRELPGDTLAEKTERVIGLYTETCRRLSIVFQERGRLPDGWLVGGPEGERNFVMVHHGVDHLRARIALDTGTQVRRATGQDSRLHERCAQLFRYR